MRGWGGPWSRGRIAVVAPVSIIAVAVAVVRGLHEQVGGDFHVFWQAGRNFFTGAPLYHGDLPGARNFIYPPFAAFAFQVFALLPLQIAASIFACLNVALWVVAAYVTRDLVARTFPDHNAARLPFVLAVVFSAQFFLNNFNLLQVNEVIFVLILLGIRAALRARDVEAAAWFVVATAIKVTPVFFVLWLLVRGRRRAQLAVPPVALACVLVPLLVRGPARGTAELEEYYHSFLRPQGSQVGTAITNQNFGALVYRMLRPSENPEQLRYQYLAASEEATARIYKTGAALLLVAFLANLVVARQRRTTISAFELSTVFLVSHLLSPITRTAHLVTLLFVFYTFLTIPRAALPRSDQVLVAALWILIAAAGLSGRDLLGRTVYHYAGGYSLVAWTMLALFIAAIVFAERAGRTLGPTAAPP
jgi:glycosyl transferase family 87